MSTYIHCMENLQQLTTKLFLFLFHSFEHCVCVCLCSRTQALNLDWLTKEPPKESFTMVSPLLANQDLRPMQFSSLTRYLTLMP